MGEIKGLMCQMKRGLPCHMGGNKDFTCTCTGGGPQHIGETAELNVATGRNKVP